MKAEARLKEAEGSRARERAEREEVLAEAVRKAHEAARADSEAVRAELLAARAEEANLRVALTVAEAAVASRHSLDQHTFLWDPKTTCIMAHSQGSAQPENNNKSQNKRITQGEKKKFSVVINRDIFTEQH